MAEAIVSVVLEQLASVIHQQTEERVRLLLGVDEEVEMLRCNFRAIQAVLNDAEKKQVKDDAVSLWLDKLKNTSYDIEDVLDEWNTMISRLQVDEVEDASKHLKKVWSIFSYYLCCCRRVVLRCDIAVKIKNLKRTLDFIAEEKDRFKFSLTEGTENLERQMTTSFIDLSEVHGRNQDKDKLLSLLLSESSDGPILSIISIVGVGGIGKTTLAQLAFNDDKVEAHFDKKIWVCVSDPFDEIRIAKALLESLIGVAPNLNELETLLGKISESLEGKKFLLVLDDAWIEISNKWEKLKHALHRGSKLGSRIVVTTRKVNTARVMGTINTNMISIGTLSNQESWSLFSRIAFFERSREEVERLEHIGQKIVDKCKGLPLAIKTLGSLLRFKGRIEEWENVLGSEFWELEEVENGLFPPLLLSYYDLPFQLRKCFSYCAIFPKDYVINKDELINLWMAHGFLKIKGKGDLEFVGEEYFKILAIRSFFQDFEKSDYDDCIISCKIHDIVHDFAQFLSKHECSYIEVYDYVESKSEHEKVRHLMISGNPLCIFDYNVRTLRSLVVQDFNMLEVDLSKLVEHLTCLRALSLEGCGIEKVPRVIKNLIHLRYLKLSQNDGLKELPETLCDLYNLQTLDLNWCQNIRKLPEGMGKLINLRHLMIDETDKLSYMPRGMERLTSLRTLCKLIISGVKGNDGNKPYSLDFLRNLNHRHGNFELEVFGNVNEVKATEFKSMKNLRGLNLTFDKENEEGRMIEENEAILESLQPPPNLERLEIENYKGKTLFPTWMILLSSLRELSLYGCRYCEYVPPLGKLLSLESLVISWNTGVKRVGNEFLGIENNATSSSSSSIIAFPKLNSLSFWKIFEWEEWNYEVRSREGDIAIMPSLYSLSIHGSPKLKAMPDYLLQSTTLEKLKIFNCSILSSYKTGIFSHIGKIIFPNLRELTLEGGGHEEENRCLPPLGRLPSLESLYIRNFYVVNRVGNEILGIESGGTSTSSIIVFPKLTTLEFSSMPNWEEWDITKKRDEDVIIMPSLYSLSVGHSPKLKALPDYLLQSTTLEKLEIFNCSILSSDKTGIFSHIGKIIFPNLRELTLYGGGQEEEIRCLPSLGRLPSLESLKIGFFNGVKRVGNEILGIESGGTSTSSIIVFPKLTTLLFLSMENWEEWDITKKRDEDVIIMPCLRSLSIKWCDKLKALPEHILQKQTLQRLEILDCLILQNIYKEGGKEWSKISHISDLSMYPV